MTIIGSVLMVFSGLLPILNNIISFGIDLKSIPYYGFPNADVAVFQYSILFLPFTLIPAVFLRAYWVTYLVPIFTYTNIIALYFTYHHKILINSDWLFYSSIAGISIIILLFYGRIREYFFNLIEAENIKNDIVELYEKDFINHESK
ncbi:MAG: hypothetical protein WCJ72_02475 [Chryseobacterium sp.]